MLQTTTALAGGAQPASSLPRQLFGREGFFAAAADGTQPTESLLRHAVRVIRTHFNMDAAFIGEIRGGHRVIRYLDAEDSFQGLAEGDSAPAEATYCQRFLDGRLPAAVPDAAAYTESGALAATHTLPVGSALGVPIQLASGEVYGAFCCISRRADRTLNERDAQTMRVFADFVAGVLESHRSAASTREDLAQRIGTMLEEQAFTIAYQPIVSVPRGRLVGYEALARFQGELARTPDVWFHEADAAGLLESLELAVLRRALQPLRQLPRGVYLSVNVSPATILSGRLAPALAGLPLRRLVLEVTEHASISDYGALAAQLAPLREQGLRLAVDDAGAGFASFRHILKMRPDDIKLDISLIRKVDRDPGARALAAALIRFAKETGSRIVAEGVETESVLAVLRTLRVDKAQGFLLGRPAPLPGKDQREEAVHA